MPDIFGLDEERPPMIGELSEGIIAKMDDCRLPLGIHFGLDEEEILWAAVVLEEPVEARRKLIAVLAEILLVKDNGSRHAEFGAEG